ncbi:MAG: M18 family aminopeptidase [Clostridiales bacterium]|nr:M18 family aminopeptidase [Clostridiales bacterium]
MINALSDFLKNSLTAYHACKNVKETLLANGFQPLLESEDWELSEEGKYFIERGGSSLIAFTVGALDSFSYKIAATHLDSPSLKLKENALVRAGKYATLNVEKYGGGIWHTFFDRPLKIAGRIIKRENDLLRSEVYTSPFNVCIPSVAIHQNRSVNDGMPINLQVDMQPLLGVYDENATLADILFGDEKENVISYDLHLVNADMPYSFGAKDEFLASPRIDNLASAYASLQAILNHGDSSGICVAAFLDNEEIGSHTAQGADGDFMENTLRRIAYAFRFDDNEYYKALASSFLLSVDNAHATHPNHPEKSDPTNKVILGGGVVIKSHANRAYITDALSSAIVQTVMERAGVTYQHFYNHSSAVSGGTLGSIALRHIGIRGADIGMAQLAMHSACECFAKTDYTQMVDALTAYYGSDFAHSAEGVFIR